MEKKNPQKWRWTKSIREEIVEVAEDLREQEEKASGPRRRALALKLKLLKDCFNKLGNVKFP